MKVRAILNPRAGVRVPGTREAVERGHAAWTDYAVVLTREPGHATALAREAAGAGADVVIAVGGDGTVNEVAQGLLGSRAALGIVPAGSGNGLARALCLPLRPDRALAALAASERRAMDVGVLNGRLFLNVAGIGFDATVGHAFHEHGRRGGRRGFLGYARLSLRELRAYVPPRLRVEVDGGEGFETSPFVLTFANGPQYGSGAVINPGARLDDGRLEVASFESGPLLDTLVAAPRLFVGGIERLRRYRRVCATRVVVTSLAPMPVHADGDPEASTTRVEVELRPLALWVLAPAAAAQHGLFERPRSEDGAARTE